MATYPTPDGGLVMQSETSKFDTPRQRLRALIRYNQFDASGVLTASYLEQLELAYLSPRHPAPAGASGVGRNPDQRGLRRPSLRA